ncbi:MAG TPA: TolC family protein [Armatimonadota bacterium]|nr:TolC family protein [Armatimonadota bacterium]
MARAVGRRALRALMAMAMTAMLAAATAAARAERAPQPAPLQLDRLIEIALEDNPELAALRSRITADRAKVPQARSLPDPMVGVMFDDVTDPGAAYSIEARQRLPWPGKLRLMSEAAALGADRTVTDYTEQAYEVVAAVKQTYYDLYFLDQSIELTLTNKDLLTDFVKLAETKYAVGAGIQQDVLRAQVAQSRILDQLLMLRQQRIAAQARLNALLNRPPEAPLGPAGEMTRHRVALPEPALAEIALQRRAMLRGMRLMTAEAQTMQALARRELKPDLELRLGVNPQGMGGGADVRGMVMFMLPLYHRTKQDQAVVQRTAEVAAADHGYDAAETMVRAMIRDLTAMLDTSDRQAELLRNGIIPQAQLSLESARAGYQVNQVDFLTLLDNQMALYNDLRDYYRAVTDYEKAVADLERTVGAPLEDAGKTQPRAAVPHEEVNE